MAKVESTTITTTAACDLGNCRSCRGTVLSLTDAHLTSCQHICHLCGGGSGGGPGDGAAAVF
jgi:hypothetical protein